MPRVAAAAAVDARTLGAPLRRAAGVGAARTAGCVARACLNKVLMVGFFFRSKDDAWTRSVL
jgi:hypothetical protein